MQCVAMRWGYISSHCSYRIRLYGISSAVVSSATPATKASKLAVSLVVEVYFAVYRKGRRFQRHKPAVRYRSSNTYYRARTSRQQSTRMNDATLARLIAMRMKAMSEVVQVEIEFRDGQSETKENDGTSFEVRWVLGLVLQSFGDLCRSVL